MEEKIRQAILVRLGSWYCSEVLYYGRTLVLKAVQVLVKLKKF